MTTKQCFPPSSLAPWGRLALGLACLTFASLAQPLSAQDDDADKATFTAIRAAEADTMTVSASGRATLSLTRAPASSSDAKLHLVNSESYSLWTGDLTKQGNNWVTQLDRSAVEALLLANAVHAEFPDAASGGKDLRISMLTEDLDGLLDSASSLVGTQPLFFKAPEAPPPLEAINPETDGIRMSSYALAARRYDEQLSAYQNQLKAAKSNAMALWTDLKTAGRMPNWPASVIEAQERAYAAVASQVKDVIAQREKLRAAATSAVESWNAAHSDAEPIELTFRDLS